MTQPTSALTPSAVSAGQYAVGFAVSEDRGFKRMRREHSLFSLRNVLGLIVGLRNSSDEFRMTLMTTSLSMPFLVAIGAHLLNGNGIVVPFPILIGTGALPVLAMIIVGMVRNVDKALLAKHKTLTAIRRSAKRVDSTARPVLTANHVYYRDKLDKLLLSGAEGMSKKERTANADGVFALMLEDFESVDEVFDLMKSRGLFSADQVRAVVIGARGVEKPLRDGAL